jgi:hypothetical protein
VGRWYGPEEEWPRHSKQAMQEALLIARSSGWHFRHGGTSHNFGRVFCNRSDEHCVFPVFGTGKNPESAARELAKRVTQCVHGAAGATKLQQSSDHVDRATHLVEAADRCRLSIDHTDQAAGLLAEAEHLLDNAEGVLLEVAFDEALEHERLASEAMEAAEEEADLGGFPPNAPVSRAPLLEAARSEIANADAVLTGLGSALAVTQLRARIEDLRNRIATKT